MNVVKILRGVFLVFTIFMFPASLLANDPAAITVTDENIQSQILTQTAFDELSDQEKKNIYINHPEQLPNNFDPQQYWNIIHPEDGVDEDYEKAQTD